MLQRLGFETKKQVYEEISSGAGPSSGSAPRGRHYERQEPPARNEPNHNYLNGVRIGEAPNPGPNAGELGEDQGPSKRRM
eukprot:548699-Prorocentrum_lima.AAC.1